ncbi:RrF2 family transcriptional regulator [Micromonospora echinofusca]|uniref:Rrf2 family transcriptional regulator n=1 Tax=Micromonospora echinofusca TaxID=47858 RepID=A0ABS3VTY6_MICEH|nr:Rrf2 family transcriptional regulator [Micromonospora echinofusca]MBO4207996.1 Rrf2 family transcriptional regulator [Micromonospora echinofusca]
MKLNRSTDMALRVVMLAGARGGRLTVEELATDLALPRNHVAKLVQRLQRMEVLVTVRGRTGGVELAPGALRLTVGHLVRAFEGADEIVDCTQPPCPLRSACRLRSTLRRAQLAFLAALDEVTLEDLIATPTGPLLLGLPLPAGQP